MPLVLKMATYNRRVSLFYIGEERASNNCAKCTLHTLSHATALVCWLLCTLRTLSHGTALVCWLLCTLLTLSHGTNSTCWLVHFAYSITRNRLGMLTFVHIAYTITRNQLDTRTCALCIHYHTEPPRDADFCELLWKQSRTRSTVASETQASQVSWLCTCTLFTRRLSLSWTRWIQSIPSPPVRLIRSSPLLRPYQTIRSSPRPCEMFHNRIIFYSEGLSAPPQAPSSRTTVVGCPWLLSVFAASLLIWRPFLLPQPGGAPCRDDRNPLITVSIDWEWSKVLRGAPRMGCVSFRKYEGHPVVAQYNFRWKFNGKSLHSLCKHYYYYYYYYYYYWLNTIQL
jgi:hypothetical protein